MEGAFRRAAAVLLLAVVLAAYGPGRGPAGQREGVPPGSLPLAEPISVGADRLLPLPDGPSAFAAIRRLLLQAQQEIDVEMYEFQRPDLEGLLVNARQRRVAVTALMDPSERLSRAVWADLEAAGVRVLAFPVEPRSIDHVKLVIADRQAAIVGGINWGRHSEVNRDYDLLAEGPVATNLQRVFDQDRTLAGDPVPVAPPAPDARVRVVVTRPASDIRDAVLDAMSAARRTIDIEMYVLSDPLVVDGLVQAAGRGVRVRVLLDPAQPQNQTALAALRGATIQARLYRAAPGIKLHAKLGIFDHAVVVFGSCNWSHSGFTRNHELDLVIQDERVAGAFLARVDQDWST